MTVLEKGRPGETYNVGGNNEMRNIDLVRLVCSLLDELHPRSDGQSYRNQITYVTDRPGHDFRYGINAGKIRYELGWQPAETAATGFRKTVQWYLDNTPWWEAIVSGKYQLERMGVPQ
jgi:dTDP-glucose 4,6-dehydratase